MDRYQGNQKSLYKTREMNETENVQMTFSQKQTDAAGRCPNCGTINEPGAMFCEQCGAPLRESVCPHCGAPVEPGTDFCEVCGNYFAEDRCSFCSAALTDQDTFCPECGSPRKGIECNICHTLSRFPFCPVCGNAITDSAQAELKHAWQVPFKREVEELEQELERLWMTAPATSNKQRMMREKNIDIRNRVLKLLEEDGEVVYQQNREVMPVMDEGKLEDLINMKKEELQRLLDKMAMPEQENPAEARILSMARKPGVSKLGWKCNYKNALHTSPLGCACPQKGGKWIVLNSDNSGSVQDDK